MICQKLPLKTYHTFCKEHLKVGSARSYIQRNIRYRFKRNSSLEKERMSEAYLRSIGDLRWSFPPVSRSLVGDEYFCN